MCNMFAECLQCVCKVFVECLQCVTFMECLQCVFNMFVECLQCVCIMFVECLQCVFNMFVECLQCALWAMAPGERQGQLQERSSSDHLYYWWCDLQWDEVCLHRHTGCQKLGGPHWSVCWHLGTCVHVCVCVQPSVRSTKFVKDSCLRGLQTYIYISV